MDVILSGLKYNSCLVYLDDILIFSPTFESHLERLELIFDRLVQANLKLNLTKSLFALPEVTYLGFRISKEGQSPDPSKLDAVKKFPVPMRVKDVRSFVSFMSYYRRFIPKFSEIAKPITRLLKLDVGFQWTESEQQAFDRLKTALLTAPVLAHYDPERDSEVRTDASGIGVGAVIVQKYPEGWKPIAYASRQLTKCEMNYGISEKECLAIIFALNKFRPFLDHRHFVVVTDHHALCFMKNKRILPARLMRWALFLEEFDFDIKYKSGSCNKDADCLSRFPVDPPDEIDLEARAHALLVNLNDSNVETAQKNDKFCRSILKQLESASQLSRNKQKRLRRFKLKDNLLYRIAWTPAYQVDLLVVPKAM